MLMKRNYIDETVRQWLIWSITQSDVTAPAFYPTQNDVQLLAIDQILHCTKWDASINSFHLIEFQPYHGYLAHVLLKHLSAITELMNRLAGFVCENGREGMGKRKKRNVLILLVNLSSYLALTGQNASMHVHICFTQVAACPFQTR